MPPSEREVDFCNAKRRKEHTKINNNRYFDYSHRNSPSVNFVDSSRTAVLGPSAALTVHWTVIHYRVAHYVNLSEGANDNKRKHKK